MRNLAELNLNEGAGRVRRPPPTARQIADFEQEFGLTLPPAYLALLRHANGGHPELNTMVPVGADPADTWGVDAFYHLDDDREGCNSLWANTETWQEFLGPDALPIGEDGGGNPFFIDTVPGSGTVNVCLHDDDFAVRELAASLEEFIDRLMISPDAI